jgi:hypothetical protein
MSINIRVKTAPGGGLQQSTSALTLKNTIQATQRIDTMGDVIADNVNTEAGSTLVYDPSTDKYIVKLLDLDGGTF